MNYHYADATNQPIGPVTAEQLHTLYRSGEITIDSFIIAEGGSDWQAYRDIAPASPPPLKALVPVLQVARMPQHAPQPLAVAPTTQKCPFCAEDIAAAAKKCKHCGETLDVALRAAEEAKRAHSHQPAVYMNAGGGGGTTVIVQQRGFPHLLHFFVSVVTAGIWLPIWILLYIFRSRSTYW